MKVADEINVNEVLEDLLKRAYKWSLREERPENLSPAKSFLICFLNDLKYDRRLGLMYDCKIEELVEQIIKKVCCEE